MKKQDALKLEIAARDLVENTNIPWYTCIKTKTMIDRSFEGIPMFDREVDDYELALFVHMDKPIFKGTKMWFKGSINTFPREIIIKNLDGSTHPILAEDGGRFKFDELLLEKPISKTIMVKLTVEVAQAMCKMKIVNDPISKVAIACKNALNRASELYD